MRGTDEREDSVNWVRVRPGFKFTNKLQIEQFQHFERARLAPKSTKSFATVRFQLFSFAVAVALGAGQARAPRIQYSQTNLF